MTIEKFMNEKLEEIKEMISKDLPKDKFDSHEFIRAFAKKFEDAYVGFLKNYEKNHHRTVHAQIAAGLLKNMDYLKIQNSKKVKSQSVFGYDVPNEEWIIIS